MKIIKARKKPVEIECVLFDGTNAKEIVEFVGKSLQVVPSKEKGKVCVIIPTLEGNHTAIPSDYVIKGVHGEFYPCKNDIFHKTYDIVSKE